MEASTSGLRLRYLGFFGPHKKPASVTFGPGLNVLYGASDTGKSFIAETIDFMLGGKPPLSEVTERVGYDRVLLGIENLSGEAFTILRSIDGGSFVLYKGLHEIPPAIDVEAKVLSELHSDKNEANLSSFLLQQCALGKKRVRKNKSGDTNSLSFRNVAQLVIIQETEIIQRRSPLSDGKVMAETSNFSTFKLMLTGVDDSALVSIPRAAEELSRDAQLELLDQLLGDYQDLLREATDSPNQLTEQLERIDSSIQQHIGLLNATEAEFQEAAKRRRELRKKLEESRDRRAEVGALQERFELLDRHYVSDIERLQGIEEGGTLFSVLGSAVCPLCGAEPQHHRAHSECDGNIDAVVEAARKEISKIEVLRAELETTMTELRREAASFDRRMPDVVQELNEISSQVDGLLAPKLAKLRTTYSTFADKRGEVREAQALLATMNDMQRRRAELERGTGEDKQSVVASGDLPPSVADAFAQTIETILASWHFPNSGRVFFDPKARDLVIAGKARTAQGKGLRAVTHAAFTLGLLAFCRQNKTPHPGFVLLDSPLLAYREPDGKEDDLRGTDLKELFYSYLQALPPTSQVIVIENSDPPAAIMKLEQVKMFSANPHSGRFGLFPIEPIASDRSADPTPGLNT